MKMRRRTKFLSFVAYPEEFNLIREACELASTHRAQFLRDAVLKKARSVLGTDRVDRYRKSQA
jgi:uncharacterized protein (DUF1778 family)